MKIEPNLFVGQTSSKASSTTTIEVSAARLAFEAMLSAGAARANVTAHAKPSAQITPTIQPKPQAEDSANTSMPLTRPGRVFDIKV